MLISTAHAQTTTTASTAADAGLFGGGLLSFLPMVAIFVFAYFVLIRPNAKRQKEAKALLAALQKGDEVVTIGGVLGTITKIGESHLSLEIAHGVEVQFQRNAIAQVLPKGTRG